VQGGVSSALQGKQRRPRRWYGFGLHGFGYYDIGLMAARLGEGQRRFGCGLPGSVERTRLRRFARALR
jgi:hypothetical protein